MRRLNKTINYHLQLIGVLVSILFIAVGSKQVISLLSTNNVSNTKQNIVSPPPTRQLSTEEYVVIREELLLTLNTQTPRKALDQLREKIKTDTAVVRSCHALAHDLGHAAYEKYQDFGEALTYKDEVCNSGYLHGIIETHFLTEADIYATLDSVCLQYPTESYIGWECYHGVGHGLMYYTSNDLPKSLELCSRYSEEFAEMACVNGVFMENFNSDNKLHISQYVRPDNPLFPCSEQLDKYKTDCYNYAPSYYLALNQSQYQQALKWCETAETEYISSCVFGVGMQAMKENISTPLYVESLCMTADKDLRASCIKGMIGLHINHFGTLTETTALCEQLQPLNRKLCQEQLKNTEKLFSFN